jgi:hypothetical protein
LIQYGSHCKHGKIDFGELENLDPNQGEAIPLPEIEAENPTKVMDSHGELPSMFLLVPF